MKRIVFIVAALGCAASYADEATVKELQFSYQAKGAGPFSADAGNAIFTRERIRKGEKRRCTLCHTSDLRATGKHANTGKPIDPLAPSVNPKRLTRKAEVEKWFNRNCKWTLGRACTPQEKGDLLAYIANQ